MSEEATWKKIDEHSKSIKDIELQQILNTKMIDTQATEFRAMNNNMSRQHGEIMTKIGAVAEDVGTVMADYHVRRGSAAITKWLVPVLISAIGLMFAYITFVQI